MDVTSGSRQQRPRGLFQKSLSSRIGHGFPEIKQPGDDADDVRIEDGDSSIEGEGGNGSSRVGADARQLAQNLGIIGNAPPVPGNNLTRGPTEISGARVISKPFPELENLFLIRAGERNDVWELLHPSLVERDHRRDGGLLQHELGDQNRIGIAGATPRQVAAVFQEPPVHRAVELPDVLLRYHLDSAGDYELNYIMSSAKTLHSHTAPLTLAQAEHLRKVLEEQGYEFEEKPYMLFSARKFKLNIAVYEKGPKAVIQGKGIEDFITFVLEPEILGEAKLGYEEVHSPELFEPHFGIDESGKGDFFGPLVIAGVYVDAALAKTFRDAGVQDSKAIGSDKRIRDLASAIRKSRAPHSLVTVAPPRYNELYRKIGNLNRLLAWGHARIIENLCDLRPDCPRALSDKFADARVLERALMEKGRKIQIDQRTKAESDFAVAAASILAREKFIDWLDDAEKSAGIKLPRGASAAVKTAARSLVEKLGPDALEHRAKTHFKTAAEVLS